MERLGYTSAARILLDKCPEFGPGLKLKKAAACVPHRIDWAFQVLGLQGNPTWKFLKIKSLQVLQWEEKVRKYYCWSRALLLL